MNGHDRKQLQIKNNVINELMKPTQKREFLRRLYIYLINSPSIRSRLEDGKVAIVQVGHITLQMHQLFRDEAQEASKRLDLGAASPIQLFDLMMQKEI
jgi:hypothetical protein